MYKLIAVALTITMLFGCESKMNEINRELSANQAQFSPLLASIENYRATNGAYPSALSDLGNLNIPKIVPSKNFKSFRPTQLTYEVGRDHTFFRVSYGLNDVDDYERLGFSIYSSIEPQWVTTTYITPLPHLEAEHYGSAYIASRSREKLDLAVQSLLSAARLNSDYPCRNFWHEWIIKSLGQGDSSPVVPLMGEREFIMYTDQEQRPVYGFAVNEVLYPSGTIPLKIVTGVYQMTLKSPEWKLMQTCDSANRRQFSTKLR